MDFWLLAVAGIFGAILGSFVNALSFRFNTGKSVMHGRSRCMHCNHTLSALDLVPVFSFLFLRGKCRYCHARISPQYIIVECIAALLSILLVLAHPHLFAYAFWMLVTMTLLFIVVYDIRHTIIPPGASIFLGILAFSGLFLHLDSNSQFITPNLWEVLAGPLLALPLFLLSLVSGGRWMGWADSGLELSLGWLLGLSMGATALTIGFWSGAIVGVALMLFSTLWHRGRKRLTIHSEVPFAPFLVFGALFAHLFHVDFFSTFAVLW